MKLFISYRRSDSTHAANRVRMCLQMKFGTDAVFIDREIPAGQPWDDYLETMLERSTGVVVLVGDEFLKLLRKGGGELTEASDPLAWEIATAMRLKKPIYPVLFGAIDMPDAAKLPEAIRAFARYQAVFAREPAFDAAMAVLIKSVAEQHHWAEPVPEGGVPAALAAQALQPARALTCLALGAAALAATWWAGAMILWLLDGQGAAARPTESAFWHGARYVLTTALWGLGPYLAYWLVAELRARARLPIFNLAGLLATASVAGILVAGGTFLLLSTLPGWRLVPLWVFPAAPGAVHYAVLAVALLGLVALALGLAVLEPRVRTWEPARRERGMQAINAASLLLVACGAWFALSLAHSLPRLFAADPVPMVGYLTLCPALSLLVAGWYEGRSRLGLREKTWQMRCLFGLVGGLYLLCTLAMFAYGPTRMLAAGV